MDRNASNLDAELYISLNGFSPGELASVDGALVNVVFLTGVPVQTVEMPMSFDVGPAAIIADANGVSYPLLTTNGSVVISRPSSLYFPLIYD